MKSQLRKLFWFILRQFESGDEVYTYKPLNRKILIVVGLLFLVLCTGAVVAAIFQGAPGYIVPILVLFAVGLVCTVVGTLGTDRAVSKIWGNR